ncbi:outer membrane beta-barrel family protein [Porphyromonas pogonae]|uniref:outer membrane beta-barrel family protein n=3 Tax=Bacteria TaxID=2 RepID=UPI002E77BCF7|nr:outer membrane beta-barrel family protein [Porphyromonas pogonae]
MKINITLLLLLVYLSPVLSQEQAKSIVLKGRVIDHNSAPISFVNVALMQGDKLIIGGVTDDNGYYKVLVPAHGTFILNASFIGYKTAKESIEVSAKNKKILFRDIILQEESTRLNEVVVQGKLPLIQQKDNKMVINTAGSIAEGVSALDMLKRLPGVGGSTDGEITLRGSHGVNLLINGSPTYLTPQQLTSLLEGMQASNIQKVEIFTSSPSYLDASGNAGTINIITKSNKTPGYAIDLGLSAGKSRKNNFFMENISASYVTDKINAFGMLDISDKHRFSDQEATTLIHDNGVPLVYSRVNTRPIKINFYTYRLGFIYKMNTRNNIEVFYNGYYDNWRLKAQSPSQAMDLQGRPVYNLNTLLDIKEPYRYGSLHTKYTYIIDSLGKNVSFDGDYIAFNNKSTGKMLVTKKLAGEPDYRTKSEFMYSQPVDINIWSGKADVDLPFDLWSLKAGVKYSDMRVHNPVEHMDNKNGVYVIDPEQSDDYHYGEKIGAAYVSAARQWKGFAIDGGLRFEYMRASQTTHGKSRVWNSANLFPHLAVTLTPHPKHRVELTLARRVNRPTYVNLSSTRWYYDAGFYTSGAPELKPEHSFTTTLSYTFAQKYTANMSYMHTTDLISEVLTQDAQGVVVSKLGNFSHGDLLYTDLVIPFNVARWWSVQASAGISLLRIPVPMKENQRMMSRAHGIFNLNQQLNLPADIMLETQMRYTGRRLNGYQLLEPEFTVDAGIKRSFCNNKLSVSLTFSDIFATLKKEYSSVSNFVDYKQTLKFDTQRAFISIKYHIGGKLNVWKEHKMEEKDRL